MILNTLFTSVGRRVELMRAFRAAYKTLNLGGRIVAVDIDPLAPALQLADSFYLVPEVNSSDYIPTLLEICRCEQIRLSFPLIDTEIPTLAKHREEFARRGTHLGAGTVEGVRIASDKWLTHEFFQRLGLPTPRSWLPEHLSEKETAFPLFVKPRYGSAAKSTFRILNQRELDFFVGYIPMPIIQEYLPGPEITTDVVCGHKGDILAVVSRRRIEVRSGEVAKGVTMYDPFISEACQKIATALAFTCPFTVQCILKDSMPYFTEINARLGGGIPLAIAAGVDVPRLLLEDRAGLPLTSQPLGTYQVGLYLTRYDDSFFLTEVKRAEVESRRF